MPLNWGGYRTSSATLAWRPTKIMNMRDLSRDDDFLSHLLVEKLGTGAVPLLVHKMDSSRRLPKTHAEDLLQIVQRLVTRKQNVQHSIKRAVDELIELSAVRFYLKSYTQKQINAFATHASRYLELYHPSGVIEISHTSRYSHRTGKSELCILATRNLPPGTVITELKGSMAHLTDQEDRELKRTDLRNSDIRRDFSVIHSKSMKKNHLFLGPARFVNHDCDNNCELFREGRYITFRTLRSIAIGDEITAHYGDGYFGRKNNHCLCETCEKRGRGGYAPDHSDGDIGSDTDSDSSDSDSESDSSDTDDDVEDDVKKSPLHLNERRTRRGVYAIMQEEDDDSDESNDEDTTIPLADAKDIPADEEIELEGVAEATQKVIPTPSASKSSSKVLPLPTPLTTKQRPRRSGSALLTNVPIDLSPNSKESSAPARVQPSSDLTTTQQDQQKKPTLRQRTVQAMGSPHEKDHNRRLHSQADLAKLQLNTPPPERPSKSVSASTRVTRSSTKDTQEMKSDSPSTLPSPPHKRTRSITKPLESMSDDTASLPETSASSSKRITRSSSSLATPLKVKDESLKVSKGDSRGKEGQEAKPAQDSETRVLRDRPSLPANQPGPVKGKSPSSKPAVPRGPDGKPLPICTTCNNVLPVISVDSEVVFGAESSPKRRKKGQQKHECPRCMRHFAIYAQPWPSRLSSHGPVPLPTPREDTPADSAPRRVTQKALPALDRKISAASRSRHRERQTLNQSKGSKRRYRNEESPSDERSSKRQKTDSTIRVRMSAEAKSSLLGKGRTRSGRHSVPSAKAQRVGTEVRKRGRPRLSSPGRQVSAPEDESSLKLKSLAVQSQPRETNGRFGKKASTNGMYMRRKSSPKRPPAMSRAERAIERGKVKSWLEQREAASEDGDGDDLNDILSDRHDHFSKRKRIRINEAAEEDSRSKRARQLEDDIGATEHTNKTTTPSDVYSSFGFKGLGLSFTPNPLAYAQRKWAPHLETEKTVVQSNRNRSPTSGEESEPPVTPEDKSVLSVDVVEVSRSEFAGEPFQLQEDHSRPGVNASRCIRVGALTHKPSPFNFARLRWGTTTVASVDDNTDVPASQGDDENDVDASEILDDISDNISASPPLRHVNRRQQDSLFKLPNPTDFILQQGAPFVHSASKLRTDLVLERSPPSMWDISSEDDDDGSETSSYETPELYAGNAPNRGAMSLHAFCHNSSSLEVADTKSPSNLVFAGWESSSEGSAES